MSILIAGVCTLITVIYAIRGVGDLLSSAARRQTEDGMEFSIVGVVFLLPMFVAGLILAALGGKLWKTAMCIQAGALLIAIGVAVILF